MTWATATWLLLAIATLQLSRSSDMAVGASLLAGMIALAVLLTVHRATQQLLKRITTRNRHRVTLAVGAALTLAVVVCSSLSIFPLAGEEIILAGLTAFAVAIFACRDDNTSLRQTAFLSAVVVLFSLPGMRDFYRLPIVLAATACGGLWFMTSLNIAPKDRWTWVYASVVIVTLMCLCLLANQLIRPTGDDNPWYAAWVPTSGGDGAGDDNARRGTGEGPDEISGQSGESLGFDQSDTFSDSGRDGLYDLWVESYGKPATSREQQRMVGLNPQDRRIVHGNDQENLKVGRSFALQRQRDSDASKGRADVAAEASLWVKGPLPAYVPLAAFHDFDGLSWHVVDPGKASVPARKVGKTAWMEILQRPLSPSFSGTNEYEIRVGDLGGDVLPMPPLVERFKMGRVSQPDFFAATRAGFVRLARRNIPAGATLNVVSKSVSPSRLVNVEPALPKHSDPDVLDTHAVSEKVRSLAMHWGEGWPRGWRQIEEVIEQLRTHVALDREVNNVEVPTQGDPIHDLLFVDRKGQDYQIASAAVMLLRSLGYPTRLMSGFYADPANLDKRSGFVALDADDVHFWIEVRLADGSWITVDPTPGYPLLNLPRSPGEWLVTTWHSARRIVTTHAMTSAAVAVCFAVTLMTGRWWIDAIATTVCRLQGHDPRLVLRVIELRARLLRRPRPPGMTVGCWLHLLDGDKTMLPFIVELNRHLYCEHPATSRSPASAHGKAVLDRLTLKTMRTLNHEAT